MSSSHSETIQYFGLRCPESATLYICEGSDNEFIGCCTSDPCSDGSGICPDGNLRTASFNPDRYDDLKEQSCDDSRGAKVWYSCKRSEPPFMGCCDINPCSSGCSRDNLLPAVLSKNETNRHFFLEPESAASSSAVSSSAASEEDDGGLGTGAIAGIAVGSTAFGIILISFLVCLSLWWRRKQKQAGAMLQSPESQRMSATVQSTPMGYDGQFFQSTSTVVPYYPSGVSSDFHNKPSPSLPTSPPNQNYHMNSIVDQNYGTPRHIVTLHEMDGAERDPLELGTDSVEEHSRIMDQGSVVGNAAQDPASRINRV